MNHQTISIHSLRVEGDLLIWLTEWTEPVFQSTPSVWRETAYFNTLTTAYGISIHSLRVEGDSKITQLSA